MTGGAFRQAQVVVVMGVSGAGKTTVASGIAAATGWAFAEGDDFHPAANVAKMAAGHALTDDDRRPWLAAIGDWVDRSLTANRSAVVSCSALKRSYREQLRAGRPTLRFCEIDVPTELIAQRIKHRPGHYMPASLLPSQLATLEPLAEDEPGARVTAAATPEETVRLALATLGLGRAASQT